MTRGLGAVATLGATAALLWGCGPGAPAAPLTVSAEVVDPGKRDPDRDVVTVRVRSEVGASVRLGPWRGRVAADGALRMRLPRAAFPRGERLVPVSVSRGGEEASGHVRVEGDGRLLTVTGPPVAEQVLRLELVDPEGRRSLKPWLPPPPAREATLTLRGVPGARVTIAGARATLDAEGRGTLTLPLGPLLEALEVRVRQARGHRSARWVAEVAASVEVPPGPHLRAPGIYRLDGVLDATRLVERAIAALPERPAVLAVEGAATRPSAWVVADGAGFIVGPSSRWADVEVVVTTDRHVVTPVRCGPYPGDDGRERYEVVPVPETRAKAWRRRTGALLAEATIAPRYRCPEGAWSRQARAEGFAVERDPRAEGSLAWWVAGVLRRVAGGGP